MKSILTFSLFVLILSACIDDINENSNDDNCPPADISSIVFSYTGDINGTYSVQGEYSPKITGTISDFNWVRGSQFNDAGNNWINIHSKQFYQNHPGTRQSLNVNLVIPDHGVGKYKIPNYEKKYDSMILPYSGIWYGLLYFSLVSGEVNVTNYECNRITGNFSGELMGVFEGDTLNIIVRDGEFDVKIHILK